MVMKRMITALISLLVLSVLAAGCVYASETQSAGAGPDTDLTYLFERGTYEKKDISLNEVERIAILFTSSPLPQSLLLDMEDMKSYYDPGRDIYYNISVSKYINDLSDNERSQIEQIWHKADFNNWDFYYEGFSEMDYECHFAVETANAVYHYEIKGVDAPAPDSLTDFITDLLHTFWNPEIS